MREAFLKELQQLLEKYSAQLTADDHWKGYAECGQDIRISVEFDDFNIEDLDLGRWVDHSNCADCRQQESQS